MDARCAGRRASVNLLAAKRKSFKQGAEEETGMKQQRNETGGKVEGPSAFSTTRPLLLAFLIAFLPRLEGHLDPGDPVLIQVLGQGADAQVNKSITMETVRHRTNMHFYLNTVLLLLPKQCNNIP